MMGSLIDRTSGDVDSQALHRLEQTDWNGLSLATADNCTGDLSGAALIDRDELDRKNAHPPSTTSEH